MVIRSHKGNLLQCVTYVLKYQFVLYQPFINGSLIERVPHFCFLRIVPLRWLLLFVLFGNDHVYPSLLGQNSSCALFVFVSPCMAAVG